MGVLLSKYLLSPKSPMVPKGPHAMNVSTKGILVKTVSRVIQPLPALPTKSCNSQSLLMAVRRTVDLMLNTSCMLNFSTAIWEICLQKAFLSGDSPLTVMKWSREMRSAPPNTSVFNISSSHGIWSSANRPIHTHTPLNNSHLHKVC